MLTADKINALFLETLKTLNYCAQKAPHPENKRKEAIRGYNKIAYALGLPELPHEV